MTPGQPNEAKGKAAETTATAKPADSPTLFHGKLLFWTTALVGASLDWWTKGAAFAFHLRHQGHVAHEQPLAVYESNLATFGVVREYNRGMAFGLMQDITAAPLVLGLTRGVVVCIILWLVRRASPSARLLKLSLGVLCAGALGNLADNLFNSDVGHAHEVRDFVHIAGSDWSLPAFNLADVCVTIGGASLVLLALRRRSQ